MGYDISIVKVRSGEPIRSSSNDRKILYLSYVTNIHMKSVLAKTKNIFGVTGMTVMEEEVMI